MTELECQLSLLPEGADQPRAMLHRAQASAGPVANFGQAVDAEVGDFSVLEVVPDLFDRIELRGVGREKLELHRPLLRFQPAPHEQALVRAQAVPDDEQRPVAQLPAQRLQEFNQLWGVDRAGEEAEVEAPEGQPGDRRELLPVEAVLNDRSPAARSPGAHYRRSLGESRLVYEDDGLAAAGGVFFSAGQRRRFQRSICASSRWMARRAGFWQEKPSRRSKCQMWPSEY